MTATISGDGTSTLINLTTSGNTVLDDASTDTLNVGNGGLVKDASGNVGVGVTPSAWTFPSLSIGGQAASFAGDANTVYAQANTYYNAGWKYVGTGYAGQYQIDRSVTATHQWFTAPSGTAGNAITFTQAMTLNASGNLGVGRTSPTARLHLSTASGNTALTLSTNNNDNANATLYNDATYCGIASNFGSTGIKVRFALATPDNAMTLDSSGNLLVGTTSTSFTVQGVRALATGQVQAVSSGSDAFAGYRLTSSAGDSIITGYSNVSSTQSLKFNVQADGNVRIAAGATYGNISDRKYKTNIVDATPKLQDVLQLQVRNFNVVGIDQKAIGFIAQEFEAVFPSLVIESTDKDFDGNDLGTTTKGIKESALVPILVKAIQEQQALITTLTDRITALEAK